MRILFKFTPIMLLLALVGAACQLPGALPGAAAQPTQTPAPTLTPTEALPAGPQPGATYAGPLIDLKNAAGGSISLTISADGLQVEGVSLLLTDLKCEHFSAGMVMQTITGRYPISNGTLKTEISGIGEFDVRFAEANTASGKIHLLYKDSLGGECDLGQVSWTGSLIKETPKPENLFPTAPPPPTPPSEPQANLIPTLTPLVQPTSVQKWNISPPPAPQVIRTVIPQEGQIRIVNDRIFKSGKRLTVLGEIENHTSQTLYSMEITVRLLGSAGKVLLEKKTRASTNFCRPGERAPFDLWVAEEPAGFAGYSLELSSESAPDIPEDNLKIIEQKLVGPSAHVIGWVEVTGEESVEYGNVVGVFYDAEGKVVGLDKVFLPAPGSILLPGDKRPFVIYPSSGNSFDHYRLIFDRGVLGPPKLDELEIQDVQAEGNTLKGKLHNPTQKTAVFPTVWAVFYDAQGQLLDIQNTFEDPSGNPDRFMMPLDDLAPGASESFEFTSTPSGYDHYELFSGYDPEF